MVTTSVEAVMAELVRYEQALTEVDRRVAGDAVALNRAGQTMAACADQIKDTPEEMTAARAGLAAAWAAPSGEAFQARSEPLPEGVAATERLFAGLGAELRRLAEVLNQTQDRVGRIHSGFNESAANIRNLLLSYPVPVPDEWRQEAIQVGSSALAAAQYSDQELDAALNQFATATTQLADRLAAAGTVKP
jgi:uncharacterized protein YukE